MAIQIQNGIFLELKINGQAIPDGHSIFKSLEMHSGFGYSVPVAKLVLYDMHDMFSGGPMNLVDGTKVSAVFTMTQEKNEPVSYDMIIFGKVKSEAIANGYERSATLVPDLPSFLIEAQRDYYDGTSISAIQQICDIHGIELDSDITTNDSMCWRNIGKSHSSYIRDILQRSYTGDQSCVTGSLEWGNVYRVRDLFTQLEKEPDILFFNLQPVTDISKTINFLEAEPDSSSGLFNVLTNYGHKHVHHNLAGENSVYAEANPLVMGQGLPLNSDIQNSIDLTTLTNGRYFDSGQKPLGGANMHEFYYHSAYLNMRHLSLFTESVRGITDTFNDVPLYSTVSYDHSDIRGAESSLNSAYSGTYLVGNKTIVIRESYYSEVYELHRCFINEPGSTPLVASSNSSNVTKKTTTSVSTSVNPSDPQRTSLAATQQNPNVKTGVTTELTEEQVLAQALGETDSDTETTNGLSSVDQFIADANAKVNSLFDSFQTQAQVYSDESIVSKYGDSYDKLDAMGREFQSALKKLDEFCSELLPSELAALDVFGPDLGSIISTVIQRVTSITKIQSELMDDANSLIASGDIPSSYLDQPKAKTNCQFVKEKLIDKANSVTSELGTNCLDKFAMDRLFSPNKDLTKKLREYESLLDDLLCADGQADSGATLTGPGSSVVTNTIA